MVQTYIMKDGKPTLIDSEQQYTDTGPPQSILIDDRFAAIVEQAKTHVQPHGLSDLVEPAYDHPWQKKVLDPSHIHITGEIPPDSDWVADERVETTPLGLEALAKGTKWDDDKPAYGLLPSYGLELAAAVAKVGAVNYGSWNFTRGLDYTQLIASARRHLSDFERGVEVDADHGLPCLGGAIWSLMALAEMTVLHPERDDRVPYAQHDPLSDPYVTSQLGRMRKAFERVRTQLKRILPVLRERRAERDAAK